MADKEKAKRLHNELMAKLPTYIDSSIDEHDFQTFKRLIGYDLNEKDKKEAKDMRGLLEVLEKNGFLDIGKYDGLLEALDKTNKTLCHETHEIAKLIKEIKACLAEINISAHRPVVAGREQMETDFFEPDLVPASDDWPMTVFLKDLAEDLTDEDIRTMKFLLRGFGGTYKNALEKMKDPLDMFTHLQQRCLLSRDNLVFLQTLIWWTGRKDLHKKLVKFAKTQSNVLHFFNTSDIPVNGYEHVHFHVAGREKMHRKKLEELRTTVSNYLQIPPDFVIVTAIEATNSILVTFMIPEGYSNILLDINDAEKSHLASKGIDEITVNGNTIACNVELADGVVEERGISRDNEVKRLLDITGKDKKEIEKLQSLLVDSESQLRKCKAEITEVESRLKWKSFEISSCLIKQYVEAKLTPKELSLKGIALKNSYNYFRHTLKKVEKLGYDKNVIHYLIEANTLFTRCQFYNYNSVIVSQQQSQIQGLQHDLIMAWQERDRHALFSNGIPEEVELSFQRIVQGALPLNLDIEAVKHGFETIFSKMEAVLTQSERDAIIKKYLKSGKDLDLFKESKRYLLDYLYSKELETKGPEVADIFEWMKGVAFTIKRMDLLEKWTHIMFEFLPTLRSLGMDQSGDEKRVPKYRTDVKETNQPAKEAPAKSQIDEMAERLKRIEDILVKNVQRMSLPGEFTGAPSFFANPKLDSLYDVMSKLPKSKLTGASP